jgi:hypothetical protein
MLMLVVVPVFSKSITRIIEQYSHCVVIKRTVDLCQKLFDSNYQTIQYPREKLIFQFLKNQTKIQYQATSFSFLFYETINRPIEKPPVLLKNQNQFLEDQLIH